MHRKSEREEKERKRDRQRRDRQRLSLSEAPGTGLRAETDAGGVVGRLRPGRRTLTYLPVVLDHRVRPKPQVCTHISAWRMALIVLSDSIETAVWGLALAQTDP